MKNINKLLLTTMSICCFLPLKINRPDIKTTLNPDTIITNNSTINYYTLIDNFENEISKDGYIYSFKKEEITKVNSVG